MSTTKTFISPTEAISYLKDNGVALSYTGLIEWAKSGRVEVVWTDKSTRRYCQEDLLEAARELISAGVDSFKELHYLKHRSHDKHINLPLAEDTTYVVIFDDDYSKLTAMPSDVRNSFIRDAISEYVPSPRKKNADTEFRLYPAEALKFLEQNGVKISDRTLRIWADKGWIESSLADSNKKQRLYNQENLLEVAKRKLGKFLTIRLYKPDSEKLMRLEPRDRRNFTQDAIQKKLSNSRK